jgi:transglutaminase-like putative cysteine protease
MTYRVLHRTSYVYESIVTASYGVVCLLPRDTPAQRVVSYGVTVVPEPDSYGEHTDFFGNRVANFSVLEGHTELVVTTSSVVDVAARQLPAFGTGPTWERAVEIVRTSDDPDMIDARQFLLASPSAPVSDAVRTFAADSFAPDRHLVDVLGDLTARIHDGFAYKTGVTTLETTPDELLALRKGVCQDFAHLQIACLRAFGVPARYVSGYLETLPPPGRPKLVGADVSHAWVSAYLPTMGWVDLDPTNNVFVGERHICTAWGRDYADVSPLRGVIFTEAKSNTMTVSVDVTAFD